MKIILLANWGLGLEILKTLHSLSTVEVIMVVTQYSNNSYNVWTNAVYNFSCRHQYRTKKQINMTFAELKDIILRSNTDLLISHSFMKIIPEHVFLVPKLGSINIHPSLLPKYRGPSPTYWVIKNLETMTGLTCHYIDDGIDTGDIIFQKKISVERDDTVESIIEKHKTIVKTVMVESISRITDSNFQPVPQISEYATFAPRP